MSVTGAKYSKHTSRAAKAKRKIMQAASRLFAERGYGNVGINEVGQSAGFGKGALYYHIRSKEDLLVSIVSDFLESLIADSTAAAGSAASVPDRVSALTQTFMVALQDQTDAMTVTHREIHAITDTGSRDLVDRLRSDYRRIWADALRPETQAGPYRAATELEVETFIGMMFAMVLWARVDIHGPSALADTLSGTILGALSATGRKAPLRRDSR